MLLLFVTGLLLGHHPFKGQRPPVEATVAPVEAAVGVVEAAVGVAVNAGFPNTVAQFCGGRRRGERKPQLLWGEGRSAVWRGFLY